MPAYRDDYPRRPRRMPERSGGRERYHGGAPERYAADRRPARRNDYYDRRGRQYPEPVRRGGYQETESRREQEYRPRTVRREQPGEYLSDISQDRYEAFAEPAQEAAGQNWDTGFDDIADFESMGAAMTVPAVSPSVPDDDFSDLDDFDDVDEWFREHSSGDDDYRAATANQRADARKGWSEENGFDGFEDDEDVSRAVRSNPVRRSNDGWFEEEDDYSAGGRGAVRKPVQVPEKKKTVPRRLILVPVCGVLLLAALVVAAVILFGGSKESSIPLDSVLDTMVVSQTDALVADFIDRSLAETQCSVFVDNRNAQLKLSDCEITFVGKNADRRSQYVTGTNPETGELERTEYAVSGMLRYNKTALRAFLDSMLDEGSTTVVDPYFEIDYENSLMTVYSGSDGWGVDVNTFLSQMCSGLAASGGGNITVSCTSGNVAAQKLTAEDIYNQAAAKPVDAYTTTDSAGNTIYHSEINGVDFSRSELEKAMAAGGSQWQIPVSVTYPQINLKDIRKYTFPDVLATYYTYYNNGDFERSHNLSLAAEHINSLIMEPGDQFSFNDRVGQRTAANGFKKAGVYAGEGTSEDYGGGICQTSSTLYYTCVLANLQIDERKNHMYTVGYMQTAQSRRKVYGNDATVNWGWTDFKFTNSKEYPIRIDFWAKGGVLTCEIRGTADGYTADLEYETLETTPYMIKYLKPDGSKDQAGQPGYRVNVYRVVYKDGVEIERKLESKNRYQPMNKVIYTNELPAGYEYGTEYDQDYTPSEEDMTTTAPTTETTGGETTAATTTPPTEAPAPETTTTEAPPAG